MDIISDKSFDLPQNVVDHLLSLGKDPVIYKLGQVCKRGHDFNNEGFSIRIKTSSACIFCKIENRKQAKAGIKTREQGFSISELTEEAKQFIISLNGDPELFRFGSVCQNNHNFNDLGVSIRYKNRSKCIICQKEYDTHKQILHCERIAARNREYRQNNKELCNKRSKEYRENNAEKIKERHKRYREANREQLLLKMRESGKVYYQRNKARYRLRNSLHYLENKEQYDLKAQKRRALKLAATVENFTAKDVRKLIVKFDNQCVYCGVKFSKEGDTKLHLDHIKPLSKGGKHAINNLVPSCQKCNLSKFYHSLSDWYFKQPFVTVERARKIVDHMKGL